MRCVISSKANFEPFKISKGISPLKLSHCGRSLILFCTLVSETSLKLNSINEFLLGSLKSLFFFGKHNFRILIHVSVGIVQFASILKRFRVFHKIEIIQVLCSWMTLLRCGKYFSLDCSDDGSSEYLNGFWSINAQYFYKLVSFSSKSPLQLMTAFFKSFLKCSHWKCLQMWELIHTCVQRLVLKDCDFKANFCVSYKFPESRRLK